MKRYGNLFETFVSYENLYYAYRKSVKGTGKTKDVCLFIYSFEKELLMLQNELISGTYIPKPYHYFRIYEPKERVISVASFRDRVVHHAIVNVLEPIFERIFIFNSFATRKNKGTHKALEIAQKYMRTNKFYLKTDIRKYFENIDHGILMSLIKKKIKDEKLISVVEKIIKNSDVSRNSSSGKGLPVGNLTSQFFANIYLDHFDHYIKDHLKIKCYIRYMDDLVFFSENKENLKEILALMNNFIKEYLHLKLKIKATYINTRHNGLSFLGMRIFPNLIRVKNENKHRIMKKIKKKEECFEKGLISEATLAQSLTSYAGYLGFADTRHFRLKQLFNFGCCP